MASNLPAPLAAFVGTLDVQSLAMSAAAVGAGAIAAQLGGAALRQVDALEDFASGGAVQEAAVDLAGGLIVDAGVTAVVYVASSPQNAAKVGGLMAVGTVLSAAAKPAAGIVVDIVDWGTSAVAGLLGKGAPPPGGLADFDPTRALTAPGGLADFAPGGMDPYAVPGGDPYAS